MDSLIHGKNVYRNRTIFWAKHYTQLKLCGESIQNDGEEEKEKGIGGSLGNRACEKIFRESGFIQVSYFGKLRMGQNTIGKISRPFFRIFELIRTVLTGI